MRAGYTWVVLNTSTMAATIKFRLNHPERAAKDQPVTINVCYYSKGQRIELSTGEAVPVNKWTGSRVKSSYQNYDKINKHLTNIEEELTDIWRTHKGVAGEALKAIVKEIVKGRPAPEEKKANPFSDYVNTFIQRCEAGTIQRSAATISQYKQSLAHIEAYAAKKGIDMTFEAITLDFYYGLTAYLWDDLGHNDNSVGKTVKNLKMFMNQAFDDDKHSNIAFKKKKFRKPSYESDEVYLTSDEIVKVYGLDLSDNPLLSMHRDLFVFNCWVGLRFGDLCQIRPEQVIQTQKGKFLKLITEKTQEEVVIPFHPLCEAIYSQYNSKLPEIEKTDSTVYNRHLKTIAQKAGLTAKCQSKNVVKGKASVVYLEKWQMVSSHTARRSFATNCVLMGIPKMTIMSITGHRTEKAFNKYIRITKIEHAKIMMEHFNNAPIMGVMRKAN